MVFGLVCLFTLYKKVKLVKVELAGKQFNLFVDLRVWLLVAYGLESVFVYNICIWI